MIHFPISLTPDAGPAIAYAMAAVRLTYPKAWVGVTAVGLPMTVTFHVYSSIYPEKMSTIGSGKTALAAWNAALDRVRSVNRKTQKRRHAGVLKINSPPGVTPPARPQKMRHENMNEKTIAFPLSLGPDSGPQESLDRSIVLRFHPRVEQFDAASWAAAHWPATNPGCYTGIFVVDNDTDDVLGVGPDAATAWADASAPLFDEISELMSESQDVNNNEYDDGTPRG